MIGSTISHYRIVAKLGEGGMGEVYRAEDTTLSRPVALKFLAAHLLHDDEAKQRFLREAKAAAAISHPNICHVYEVGEERGRTFLAMAYLEGESLEARIEKGPLPLKDALDIGRQVAEGLEAAHEKGIVHRDIKPANVMLDAKGRATILDFGLARLNEASRLTRVDQTVGTMAYMSPEQVQGGEVDSRTDIWALGCVLYEMIAGVRPAQAQYDQALAYEILNEEPEPLTAVRSGVPMELEFIVGKCLAKDPQDRTGSAQEVARELRTLAERLKSGRSKVMTAGSAVTAPSKTPRRSAFLPWALAALMTAVALAFAVAYFSSAPSERRVRRFSFTQELLREQAFVARSVARAVISPDGRSIVYVSGDDPPALWLRDLASEQPRKLPGTDGANYGPFWSPDSQYIGFHADRQLKKIAVAGGPPIPLCDAHDQWQGGTWSPDGDTIVFTAGVRSDNTPRLYEVSASGGDPQRLTNPESRAERHPAFVVSKGAAAGLLFFSQTSSGQGVYVRDLVAGSIRKIADGAQPVLSQTGHILYRTNVLDAGIWALPISADTLEATGEAFPIAEGVADASVSNDGTLVTVDVFDVAQNKLVWRSRRGEKLDETSLSLYRVSAPTISSDGRRVVFGASEGLSSYPQIWISDLDRGATRRLTFADEADAFPTWSADGEEVAFNRFATGGGDLLSQRVDGGREVRVLVASEEGEYWPDWSPDGERLVYTVNSEKPEREGLWVMDVVSGEARSLIASSFGLHTPQISPSGRYVACCSDESGSMQVYVREFPSGEGLWQMSERNGYQPRWSPDGKELVYLEGGTHTLIAIAVSESPEFRVGRAERLFQHPELHGVIWDYDVHPDGRILMVESVEPQDSARLPAIHVTENWYEEFRGPGGRR